MSDKVALECLAARLGRDLAAEGVDVVPIGGATNIRTFVLEYRATGTRLAGLVDAQEAPGFRRVLDVRDDAQLEALGFFVCQADLEDELIRALSPAAVEQVIEAQGDLRSFRTFQHQPAQQGRTPEAHLRRFMGTRSGRKEQYARLLVEALDLAQTPRPLANVLAFTTNG